LTKTIKNIGASVRAKLLNLSTENDLDYNYLLIDRIYDFIEPTFHFNENKIWNPENGMWE
jgi:hypothetical protein